MHSLLGLLMNLTVDGSEISAVKDIAARLTSPCVSLAKCEKENIEIRAVGVLSHILPLDGAAVVRACEAGLVPCLVTMLQVRDCCTAFQKSVCLFLFFRVCLYRFSVGMMNFFLENLCTSFIKQS